jgi:4-amino-4-deoxy-L-arabinose transferase-like glycosyltransferase
LLAVHALVWTLAAWLSRGNLDVPGDMVENYTWGIEWQGGYHSHPPLFAWVTAAWFSVFPRTDLAYFALSFLNVGVGLFGVLALAKRFLSRDAALLATLALAMSPAYTSLAIKFNANAIQLSLWPWAVAMYVAFMQEGRPRQLIACAGLVALAMLGKYFSAVLALSLLVVALVVPAWRARLRGWAPWLAMVAGLLVLTPHLSWMADHAFSTLKFAQARSAGEAVPALLRLLNFVVAQGLYLLPSFVFLLLAVARGQRLRAVSLVAQGALRPQQQPQLWWLTWTPLLVIVGIVVVRHTEMASVWGIALWYSATIWWVALLTQQGVAPGRDGLERTLLAIWLLVLVLAAMVGVLNARQGQEDAAAPRAELARAAQSVWRERVGTDLRVVTGSVTESRSVAFYAEGKVRWWNLMAPQSTPWLSLDDVRKTGLLIVCAAEEQACHAAAQALVAQAPVGVSVHKTVWGQTQAPRQFQLYLLPPA